MNRLILLLLILAFPFLGMSQNFYEFTKSKNGENLNGLLNESGQEIIEPNYQSIVRTFISGAPLLLAKDKAHFQVFNTQGLTLNSKLDSIYINDCTNKLLLVQKNKKWGFINEAGKFIFMPEYDSAGIFQKDTSIAYMDGYPYIITSSGSKQKVSKNHPKTNTHFNKCDEVEFGLDLSNAGSTAIKAQHGKYGVFKSGVWLIKPEYDKINVGFSSYLVRKNGLWAIFDEKGDQVTEFKYEGLKIFQ